MGKIKPILIFIIIFSVLVISAGVVMNMSTAQKIEEKEESTGESETVSSELALSDIERDKSLQDTIHAFAEVLYTYDTRERKFYEGADQYMTDIGYKSIVPLADGTEGETVVNMSSKLDKIICYYRKGSTDNEEVLAEVWYSISGAGDYQIQQIIKINAIYQENWKISQCTVLSTMEQ